MKNRETGIPVFFACSGASNLGELSDRVTRKLVKEGKGRMM